MSKTAPYFFSLTLALNARLLFFFEVWSPRDRGIEASPAHHHEVDRYEHEPDYREWRDRVVEDQRADVP